MPPLNTPEPCILKLFVAPQRVQPIELVAKQVAAARRRGGEIEQSAVRIENACPNSLQASYGHDDLLGSSCSAFGNMRSRLSTGRVILFDDEGDGLQDLRKRRPRERHCLDRGAIERAIGLH